MQAFTDYPFEFLGDKPGEKAPIRMVEVHGWDGDKYATITVCDRQTSVKVGYLYQQHGRCGSVPAINTDVLIVIPF